METTEPEHRKINAANESSTSEAKPTPMQESKAYLKALKLRLSEV